MLRLSEVVAQTPVHVFYVGTEAEFLDEVAGLAEPVRDAEHLEFTCVADEHELVARLLVYAAHEPVVVFGLLRHLERGGAPADAVLRAWTAVLSTGVPRLRFGDTARSPLVENLLSTSNK